MVLRPSIIILILLVLSVLPCISQTRDTARPELNENEIIDSLWRVDSIVIAGNNHTKDFVILREMSLRSGSFITRSSLSYDQDRIYSLRLFNEVRIHVIPTSPGLATLIVQVSERWYIFPYPILGLRDRDWKKVFFGAGILHSNFRGRNEKLYASIIFGYDPALAFSYATPFLDTAGTEFMNTRLSLNRVENRSLLAEQNGSNFEERHISAGITYGKRVGIAHTFWLSAGFEFVQVSDYLPGRTISTSGIDRYPVVSAGYSYDTRDLGEYPGKGAYLGASVTKFGVPSKELDYARYDFDGQAYLPLPGSFVLAARIYADIASAGPVPPYNHVYFGYGNRIRGHFKEIYEGDQLVGSTIELHEPIISPRYFTVDGLPTQFGVWRFGVVAALFADAGTVWFRPAPFAVNRMLKGYGVGLHFLLPYSFILRTEYALNETRQGQFILDVGNSL